jgi:hypothetical protein
MPFNPSITNNNKNYKPITPHVYSVGDIGKSEDLSIFSALEVKMLRVGDFAFVRRSNGVWQYSVVIDTPTIYACQEPCIKFRLDPKGFTKNIPMTLWAGYIRLLKEPRPPLSKKTSLRRVLWADSFNCEKEPQEDENPKVSGVDNAPRERRRRRLSCDGNFQHSQRTTLFLSALASIDQNNLFHLPS